MYMLDEATQKKIVATVASIIAEGLVMLPEKISGENTNKFLIHCLGLNNVKRSRQLFIDNVTLFLYMLTGR